MSDSPKPRVLVAGCGYIGEALADALHAAGWEVVALTHSEGSAIRLRVDKAYRVDAVSIGDSDAVAQFAQEVPPFAAAVHCASSRRGGGIDAYREVYRDGCRNLSDVLQPGHLIFTSSTSVYPQVNGESVDEDSRAVPTAETGRVLREAEEIVLKGEGTVVRLAGIYGPDRSVLLRSFLEETTSIDFRESIPTPDGRWINQVHREDVVAALVHLASNAEFHGGQIYNLSDGRPMTQRAVYEEMSKHFGPAEPPTMKADPNKKRGWTNKRVTNAKLRGTGWEPRYSSYPEALQNDVNLASSILSQVEERKAHRSAISRDDCVLVFDKDGVLFNSEPVKLAAFESLFDEFPEHSEAIRNFNRTNVGAPRPEKLGHIFKTIFGYSDEKALSMRDEFMRRAAELVGRLLPSVPLAPGAEMLLRESPCPKYLCSAAPEEEVREQLDHHGLTELFEDTFADPNKKADVLRRLASEYPNRKLVFWGDTIRDLKAAKAAEVYFVGVERYDRVEVMNDPHVPVIRDFTGGCGIKDALERQQEKLEAKLLFDVRE
jgi:nucleoside-diphosphate-sugar epimerase/phosphoglycolate phosphatase-like HAD superfamily hydrolase